MDSWFLDSVYYCKKASRKNKMDITNIISVFTDLVENKGLLVYFTVTVLCTFFLASVTHSKNLFIVTFVFLVLAFLSLLTIAFILLLMP